MVRGRRSAPHAPEPIGRLGCGGHRHLRRKLELVSTAFGEAAIAVNNAGTYVTRSATVGPGHSTGSPAVTGK